MKDKAIAKKKQKPFVPFRFTDLPAELRHEVLKYHFPPLRLDIESRNCSCHDQDGCADISILQANMPAVLLVNKSMYADAIALYKNWEITLVTYDILPNDVLTRINAKGFKNVTKMFIDEETALLPDPALLPSLKEVTCHLCWDNEYDSEDKLSYDNADEEGVLAHILNLYETKNIRYCIDDFKAGGNLLPYKIFLEAEVLVECDGDNCDLMWWQNILVDVETREFVRSGELSEAGHDERCPHHPDYDEDEAQDETNGDEADEEEKPDSGAPEDKNCEDETSEGGAGDGNGSETLITVAVPTSALGTTNQ